MSRPKLLDRLLRIREIQEDQKRRQLDAALAKLESLQRTRSAAAGMDRRGQTLVRASVISGEMTDRQAGLIQTEFARRRTRMLAPRIASAQKDSDELRREFMDTRMERRQVETLVNLNDMREKMESDRRSQRSIDDWYSAKTHQKGSRNQNHE